MFSVAPSELTVHPGSCAAHSGKRTFFTNLVDVGDNTLDYDVSIVVPGFREEFGQRLLGSVPFLLRIGFLFSPPRRL